MSEPFEYDIFAVNASSKTLPRQTLLVPLVPDDLEHSFSIRRLFESLPELGPVQEFGNVRQRMQMFLELALRHQEEHHKVHGLIVQGIETDSLLRTAQRA